MITVTLYELAALSGVAGVFGLLTTLGIIIALMIWEQLKIEDRRWRG